MNAKQQTRKRLVIAGVFLICSVSFMAMIYLFFNKPEVYVMPGVVVSKPAPVASPVASFPPRLNSRLPHAVTPGNKVSSYKQVTPVVPKTSSYRIWTSSSAKVHDAGGGGSYGSSYTASGANTSGGSYGAPSQRADRGINYSGAVNAMPSTSFLALASSRPMAAPEAESAPQMARLAADPRRAPGPPNTGDDPLPGDHQLVEHPVGAPWVMMFFALLYALYISLTPIARKHANFFICRCTDRSR